MALKLTLSAAMLIGACVLTLMTVAAFAGHPSDQIIWLVAKWRRTFDDDAAGPIHVIALLSVVSLCLFVGGIALGASLLHSSKKSTFC